MTKIAVVDFDQTLLQKDSLAEIIWQERLYLTPTIFFAGLTLFFGRFIFSRSRQIPLRKRFKSAVFRTIFQTGATHELINRYAEQLKKHLNEPLIQLLNTTYEHIYIVSASWDRLIVATLAAHDPPLRWQVVATGAAEDGTVRVVCWYTQKVERLAELGITSFDVFTDSFDDLPLIERAQQAFLVTGTTWKKL